MPTSPFFLSNNRKCISHGFFNFSDNPSPIWDSCLCSNFTLVNPSLSMIWYSSSALFFTITVSCSTPLTSISIE
ncbi:MAG: hypothetical protein FJ357_02355 [Thaumarchaeota archaeon]|nr:hypothetical protein [Nitrososphaerota archaeon]